MYTLSFGNIKVWYMTKIYNTQRNCLSIMQEFLVLGYVLIPESGIHRKVKNIYSDISRKPHNPGSSGWERESVVFFFFLFFFIYKSNRVLLIAFNFVVFNIHNSCIIWTYPISLMENEITFMFAEWRIRSYYPVACISSTKFSINRWNILMHCCILWRKSALET